MLHLHYSPRHTSTLYIESSKCYICSEALRNRTFGLELTLVGSAWPGTSSSTTLNLRFAGSLVPASGDGSLMLTYLIAVTKRVYKSVPVVWT